MIDGFKIDLPSEEMVAILRAKEDYHTKRANAYAEQAQGIKNLQAEDGGLQSYSNNPGRSLSSSAEEHKKKALYYAFMAEHVIPKEVYRLGDADLMRMGISNPGY